MGDTALTAGIDAPGAVTVEERRVAEGVPEAEGLTGASEWRPRPRPELRPFAQAEGEKPLEAFEAPPVCRPIPATWESPPA